MNNYSKKIFNLWMSGYPESFHPLDEARMFDLANTLFETDDNICIDEIFTSFTKCHPSYNKEEAMRLSDKWEEQIFLIKRFLAWQQENNSRL